MTNDTSTRAERASSPISTDSLIEQTVAACKTALKFTVALRRRGEQYLRAIREAGRLLSLVQRSRGGRPMNNVSAGLTSYQLAVRDAGISRETACVWRRVSAISDADFERFIDSAKRSGGDLTQTALVAACLPPSAARDKRCAVTLHLSEADHRRFQQRVGVLGATHFATTVTEAVLAVVDRAYSTWLATQHEARGSSSASQKAATDRHG